MRVKGKNPFGNYRDTSPAQEKSPNGPFPGDQAIFSFNLYRDAALRRRAGIATFICFYNFHKNAFCNAAFRLASGATVFATGSFDFDATGFTLSVTGGYAGFAGASGTVEETPSARHAQRLRFALG